MDTTQLTPILYDQGAYLNWWQMALRALIVYLTTLLIVRMGKKRLFGRNTAMDVVLGVILGSMMSRAINGATTLLPTAVAGLSLVFLHFLSGKAAIALDWFGPLVKGRDRQLVKDGKRMEEAMRRSSIGHRDLEEAARSTGKCDVTQIQDAWLERSGNISIIPARKPPQVVEVKVEAGVQTVRVELG